MPTFSYPNDQIRAHESFPYGYHHQNPVFCTMQAICQCVRLNGFSTCGCRFSSDKWLMVSECFITSTYADDFSKAWSFLLNYALHYAGHLSHVITEARQKGSCHSRAYGIGPGIFTNTFTIFGLVALSDNLTHEECYSTRFVCVTSLHTWSRRESSTFGNERCL